MKKQGFTLIEVVIVIVILGVLASLALPRITGQLEVVNAAEVMNIFGAIRRAFVDCVDANDGDSDNCITSAALGVAVPPGNKFTYTSAYTWQWIAGFEAHRQIGGVDNAICIWINDTPGAESVVFGVNPINSVYLGVVQRIGAMAPLNAGVYAFAGSQCGINYTPY
jgi:prepilin-type N-terminal cleavage/methylation domain-containing protein